MSRKERPRPRRLLKSAIHVHETTVKVLIDNIEVKSDLFVRDRLAGGRE